MANKVNAPGVDLEARFDAVEGRIDETAMHGVRLGSSLSLAAMETHTGVDYSTQPVGFRDGAPEEVEGIETTLENLEGHAAAIADLIEPQSVLNRLFD